MVKPGVGQVTPWYVGGVGTIGSPVASAELSQVDGSVGKAYAPPENGKSHIACIRYPEAGNTAPNPILKVVHQGLIFVIAQYFVTWFQALTEELYSCAVGVVFPGSC